MNTFELIQQIKLEIKKGIIKPSNKFAAKTEENFVIPHPSGGESENQFISRCMSSLGDEDKPQDQLLAICYAAWEKK